MKKVWKIVLAVLLVLVFAAAVLFGVHWYSSTRTPEAAISTEGQVYETTAASSETGNEELDEALKEEDNLKSDSAIKEETTWPFADNETDAKNSFVAKKSTGYTTKKSSSKSASPKETTTTKKNSKETTTEKTTKKTTKKSSGSSSSVKSFLQNIQSSASSTKNGHPVKVDSNGINIEYKKFAVADLNGDGKDEVFLYAESTKGKEFYGNSYIVYDSSLKSSRTTMVVDEYAGPTFYASGAFEIVKNKFGFVSDSVAQSFGVKNANSILGFDNTTTPYLQYMTNGPYIDAPKEISAADYNAAVKKLKAGGKVSVKVQDFTSANVEKL